MQIPVSLPMEESDRKMLAEVVMREDEPLTQELLQGAIEELAAPDTGLPPGAGDQTGDCGSGAQQ